MSININSEVECRKAYINYQNYGNTMGITADEFDQMTAKWSHKLESWIASVSSDETEYDYTDEEWAGYKTQGHSKAEEKAGHDGSETGMYLRGGADFVLSGGNALMAGEALTSNSVVNGLGSKLGNVFAKESTLGLSSKAVTKLGEGGAIEASETISKNAGFIITAPLVLGSGILYKTTKPNEEERNASNQLAQYLSTEQESALEDEQIKMAETAEAIEEDAEKAEEANEECSEDIEDMTEEVNPHSDTLKNLKAKRASGVALTESEKMQYDASLKEVEAASGDKGTLATRAKEATGELKELSDEMGDYQDTFDESASLMAETEAMTEFADNLSSATEAMNYFEAGAQALNAVGGAKGAKEALAVTNLPFGAGLWAWAFVGLGTAGAAGSTLAVTEQISWAEEMDEVQNTASLTNDYNGVTHDVYDESLDYYDGTLQSIDELGEELPKQYEEPIEELTTTAEDAATLDVNSGSGPAKVGAAPGATGLFTTPAAPWGQPATGTPAMPGAQPATGTPGLPGGQGANPYAPGVTMTTAPANNNENDVNNSNNNNDPNNLKNKKEDEKK